MRLKVYVIDVRVPLWAKRTLAVGISVLVLGTVGVALATPPHNFSPSTVLHAGDLNDNFRDLDSRLGAFETPPAARYWFNPGAAPVPSGVLTEFTSAYVSYTKDFDTTVGAFSTTTGRFTAPTSGKYLVSVYLAFESAAWTVGADTELHLLRQSADTSPASGIDLRPAESTNIVIRALSGTQVLALQAGESASIGVFQNSGTPKALLPTGWVSIVKVSN